MRIELYPRATTAVLLLFSAMLIASRSTGQERFFLLVKDAYTGVPLSYATITAGSQTMVSDSAGIFVVAGDFFDGTEKLLITLSGYKPRAVHPRHLTDGTVTLKPYAATLQEVVITGASTRQRAQSLQMGAETVTAREAKNLPAILGEVDIIKILQLKPGVKNAGEGMAGFYVRGGGADQNLITIDGVPLYNPSHLLGLFSVFNNDAIRDVKLYKSAYPARYGGRLSSALDVTSRQGSFDSMALTGGIGALSSRLSYEAPIIKGKSSFIISGRRTYFDAFTRIINRMNGNKADYQPIPSYFFSDFNFRSDWKVNSRNTISATGYFGSDHFNSNERSYPATFRWGNSAAALNWKSVLVPGYQLTSSVFYSGYQYRLGNRYDYNNIEVHSAINTIGSNIMLSRQTEAGHELQAGATVMRHALTIGDFQSASTMNSNSAGERLGGTEWAAYVNSTFEVNRSLAVSGGWRMSGFMAPGKSYINGEPRISGRLTLDDDGAIKASYSRMVQYLHLASLSSVSLPVDIWYPSTATTRPQTADQLSLGYSRALGSLFLNVEGYYKWMDNQVEFRDGADLVGNPHLEKDFVYGKGTAYGLETYVEKKAGRSRGWIGYTLSWATRRFDDINDGRPFRPRYDRRHDVSLVVMHQLNDRLSLSGNWVFGTGAYTTVPVGRYLFQNEAGIQPRNLIPVYRDRNNFQLQPVHRLDLSLVMDLKSKRGQQDITFSLYNAYSRRNPFYMQFAESSDKEGYITSVFPKVVSLFPVLPGVTYNFKF